MKGGCRLLSMGKVWGERGGVVFVRVLLRVDCDLAKYDGVHCAKFPYRRSYDFNRKRRSANSAMICDRGQRTHAETLTTCIFSGPLFTDKPVEPAAASEVVM